MHHRSSFHKKIKSACAEIELAVRLHSPMIIPVIYTTTHVYDDALALFFEELAIFGQLLIPIELNSQQKNLMAYIQLEKRPNVLFSVSGFDKAGGNNQADAYRFLNLYREYFIEQNARILLWLKPEELQRMTLYAPDFWAFRHFVLDFSKNRATPKRSAKFEGLSLERFPWNVPDTNVEEALAYRQKELSALPLSDEALIMRLDIYGQIAGLNFEKGFFTEARQMLLDALQLFPENLLHPLKAKFLWALVTILIKQGDIAEAEIAAQEAMNLVNPDGFFLITSAQLHRQLGRNTEALKIALKALQQVPEDAISWNEVGNIYANLGRFDESIMAYKKALAYLDDPKIRINQAALLYSVGKEAEAKEVLQAISCERLRSFSKGRNPFFDDLVEELC